MCIAVPAQVIKVTENKALVNFGGVNIKVDTSLVDVLNIGDYILLHAGCAIEKLNKKEAQKTLELFEHILKDE
ncbi:HypC/HybG/HupF family hydrogenase formation chaperone [Marinisporobacter balticus]|uniref:Hydrogenase maturation protein HypC n=1 Tax=Marinisporobacter balticus TaxID=2018667 RepID=A0A4R2L618_9FIRM|nr:HypC/HybG/HupF family hydrogenase formation chaperone [Marinisporobacter balticus]TCO74625.1 hydrogenase maturation protein HypC [Marinisporobacter balticus]